MDQNEVLGVAIGIAVLCCFVVALLSSAVTSSVWTSGCERYCEPFAMDRDNTYQYRVCYCMGQDK
jgi:hypothetical protein